MEQVTKSQMKHLCQIVDEFLPNKHGFIIFTFPTGDAPDRRTRYSSNCSRKDTVNLIKEWMIERGYDEDWMRDVD